MGACDACLPCCKCFSGCGRVVLVLINLPFIVLGILLSVAGILIMTNDNLIMQYINQFKESVSINIDLSSFNIAEVFGSVATGLVVFGLFLLILTFLGCCGACYGVCLNKCTYLLVPYVIILIILVLAQAVVWGLVLVQPRPYDNQIKSTLKDSLNKFEGFQSQDSVSIVWNAAMFTLQCCGVDSSQDFQDAENWVSSVTYEGRSYQLRHPIFCCQGQPDENLDCARENGNGPDNANVGCYDKAFETILSEENRKIAYGILVGTLAPQVIIIILAIIVLCMNNKAKVSPV